MLEAPLPSDPSGGPPPAAIPAAASEGNRHSSSSFTGHRPVARVMELGPGCLVGPHDFYLARASGLNARCRSPTCRVMALPRAEFGRLMGEAPAALSMLQFVIARSLSLAEASEPPVGERK